MAYQIKFAEIVIKEQIPAIPMPYRQQIRRAIEERLTVDPVKFGKPLKYSLLGFRRLRVGTDNLIIYSVIVCIFLDLCYTYTKVRRACEF